MRITVTERNSINQSGSRDLVRRVAPDEIGECFRSVIIINCTSFFQLMIDTYNLLLFVLFFLHEIEIFDRIILQFNGEEEVLIETLRTMEERSRLSTSEVYLAFLEVEILSSPKVQRRSNRYDPGK